MAELRLVGGTLYINRDRDYRTQQWGPYVKIGIVRDEREASARVREHQTGNPREVVSIHEFKAPMVEALETQLHHRFSQYWTSGEWFHMDQRFVNEVLVPEINTLIQEQTQVFDCFVDKARVKSMESNGITRNPTAIELREFEALKQAEAVYALAKLDRDIADLRLRNMVGLSGGLDGVLTLVSRRLSPSFDKTLFRESHPDLWDTYQATTVSKPKGTLRFSSRVALTKLAPEKVALKKSLSAIGPAFTPAQASNEVAFRNDEIIDLHDAFIRSLGPLARAEWRVESLKALFASRLGTDEAIANICTWKRKPIIKTEFDEKTFRVDYPDHYERFLGTPSSAVSVKINFHRPYAHHKCEVL